MGRRVTYNNRRIQGARHNDRKFDLNAENAKHINTEKTKLNVYDHYYMDESNPENPDNKLSFEEVEKRFYEEVFTDGLNAINDRYLKSRHKEDCKTIDQYRTAKRTCPEESLYYFGDKDNHITPDQFKELYGAYTDWHDEIFGNHIVILNAALHLDEATPHIHERKVWIAEDKDGNYIVNQNQALKALGIERPKPEEKETRYNNAKITYSKMCREKLQELCLERGYELITEPTGKGGLELAEYKRQQLIAENEKLRREGEKIKRDAETQALNIKADAEKKAKKIIKDAEKKKAEIEQETFDLETKKFSIETDLKREETKIKNLKEQAITLNEKIKNVDDEINKRVQERLDKEVKKEINKIKEQVIEETKQEIYGKYDDWYDALDDDMKDYLQGRGLKDLLEEKIEVKRSYGMSR